MSFTSRAQFWKLPPRAVHRTSTAKAFACDPSSCADQVVVAVAEHVAHVVSAARSEAAFHTATE
ncbi:hypothetical protein [Xanthomonas sp. 10-10]|uniref:Uncharacterized protein n=1 Tax=Xanthomonas sp. 10-10 TaxID=3115848 RepID=A0AAU7PDF7_9XANT